MLRPGKINLPGTCTPGQVCGTGTRNQPLHFPPRTRQARRLLDLEHLVVGMRLLVNFQGYVVPLFGGLDGLVLDLHRGHGLREVGGVTVNVDRVAHLERTGERKHGYVDVIEVMGDLPNFHVGHGATSFWWLAEGWGWPYFNPNDRIGCDKFCIIAKLVRLDKM